MVTRLRSWGQKRAGSTPRARQMPSFHGSPRGTSGHSSSPTTCGRIPAQTSTNGCPATSTCGPETDAASRDSFDPRTRWSTSTPSRRAADGPNLATAATRSSMPCIGSTTIAASRRSSPHTCSSSSASWRPSTQMRLDAATWAALDPPPTEPEAVTGGRTAGATTGRRSVTGRPSSRNPPAFHAKWRWCWRRSRSVTASLDHRTTSPQNPLDRSSTTRPTATSTSG